MKRAVPFFLLIPVLAMFVLGAACSLPNDPMPGNPGLMIGIGLAQEGKISEGGTERTISPQFTQPYLSLFNKLVLVIDGVPESGGTFYQEFVNPTSSIVDVPYGSYTVSVKAYKNADDNPDDYAAFGSAQHIYSSSDRYVYVILGPVADEGAGTLKYKLTDISGIITSAVLIRYADLGSYPNIDSETDPQYPYSLAVNANLIEEYNEQPLPAGYYVLMFGNNVPYVIQIYKNFDTLVELTIETTGIAATPIASHAEGVVAPGTAVTLSCSTEGADIFYTVDGSAPTTSSAQYDDAAPIVISSSPTTIKAIAVKAAMAGSTVMSVTYQFKADMPAASLAAGEVSFGTLVTLSSATNGAEIYYTTDGSTPANPGILYSAPVSINSATTIKAIAVKDGWVDSDVLTVMYTYTDPDF